MGIFFESKPLFPPLRLALESALKVPPITIPNLGGEAITRAAQLHQEVVGQINWARLGIALCICAVLLVLAIYTAHQNLADISKSLMTTFQSFSGLVVGLLGGEAVSRR
jgi:hypothetical protein